ncbi:MAG TPA: LytTR family DNA-binding domain-containing protein [Thermoanaerobaculia bacterium]|nr:LytTR family DNA-binding domain-containing protein [Thermoanaerobaculia bacterium]
MTLRVIIADDEPLARARIRRLLGDIPDVEIVAECVDGFDAAEAIRAKRPDIAFLDIEMPELDGFEVLAELGDAAPPAVIFVTAYDQHAIRAFEAAALDYVLKPVTGARLHRALDRARGKAGRGAGEPIERLAVRVKGRVLLLRVREITYIEAAGNYARVHIGKESHLVRQTLAALEEKLDPKHFVRIHRSTIVNIDAIRELQPWFGGDSVIVLNDGTELTMSRTYRDRVAPRLGL